MIKQSVGLNGKNNFHDVKLIQTLINGCVNDIDGLTTIPVDGICTPKTVTAIKQVNKKLAAKDTTAAVVEPDSDALKKLVKKSKEKKAEKITCFPLKVRPAQSYKTGMRKFGTSRKGGRLHAGCDLYAKKGTEILALRDGLVTRGMYDFYLGTFAVEIDHCDFIARYGEISGVVKGLKKGSKVKAGQVIAYVGYLKQLNMSMLHLELYSGKSKGALTDDKNKPYLRRADLIDPTPILDAATNIINKK